MLRQISLAWRNDKNNRRTIGLLSLDNWRGGKLWRNKNELSTLVFHSLLFYVDIFNNLIIAITVPYFANSIDSNKFCKILYNTDCIYFVCQYGKLNFLCAGQCANKTMETIKSKLSVRRTCPAHSPFFPLGSVWYRMVPVNICTLPPTEEKIWRCPKCPKIQEHAATEMQKS